MARIEIGRYVLPEPTEFTNTFECAAWWEKVLVPAGSYPIFWDPTAASTRWVTVTLPGTVTDSYFPALWCGMSVGSQDPRKGIGEDRHAHIQTYDYGVAQCWSEPEAEGKPEDIARHERWQLDPNVVYADFTWYESDRGPDRPAELRKLYTLHWRNVPHLHAQAMLSRTRLAEKVGTPDDGPDPWLTQDLLTRWSALEEVEDEMLIRDALYELSVRVGVLWSRNFQAYREARRAEEARECVEQYRRKCAERRLAQDR